jgi:hypothetical protein
MPKIIIKYYKEESAYNREMYISGILCCCKQFSKDIFKNDLIKLPKIFANHILEPHPIISIEKSSKKIRFCPYCGEEVTFFITPNPSQIERFQLNKMGEMHIENLP